MRRSARILCVGFVFCAVAALAPLPYFLPRVLSRLRPDLQFFVPTDEKVVFLTIDDAPSQNTHAILAVLEKHDVPATFFVTADRVRSPAALREIAVAGHTLGNHLRTTAPTTALSLPEFTHDFDACAELLAPHAKSVRLFRPSSDFATREQIAHTRSRGHHAVIGTVFPLDHWISDPAWLARFAGWLTVRAASSYCTTAIHGEQSPRIHWTA